MESKAYNEILSECRLCPRNCRADRLKGETGYCGMGINVRTARAALHLWEEPCITGEHGSGAVFFSGCSLDCVFCQNKAISKGISGKDIDVKRLSEIYLELQKKKASNINLVTPTHFIPQIINSISLARCKGLRLPVVYNTSGYENVSALRLLKGTVDVYLPDLKYIDPALSKMYSNAEDYFIKASSAIDEMVRQTGKIEFEYGGLIKRGVIVRHMVMPGHTKDSKAIIKYLHEKYGDSIYISIMNQYTPVSGLDKYPEINRRVTAYEYDKVINYAIDIGVENGFIQEENTAKESFIPLFNNDGV